MKSPSQPSPLIYINPDTLGPPPQKFSKEYKGKGNLTYSYGTGVQEVMSLSLHIRNTLKSKQVNFNRLLSAFPLPHNNTKTWHNTNLFVNDCQPACFDEFKSSVVTKYQP